MGVGHGVRVLLGVVSPFLAVLLLFFAMYRCRNGSSSPGGGAWRRWRWKRRGLSSAGNGEGEEGGEEEAEAEELMSFPGGEDLTVHGILDAPGEVVGKSEYGTLYKACVSGGGGGGGSGRVASLMLLRFVRPACTGKTREILPAVRLLGLVRHPNLVPLRALYVGPRGEKLLVHPFFPAGNLSDFMKDGKVDSYKWEVINKLAVGIAEGLDHLHNGLQRPVVHGNLKSKNVLLDADYRPRLSDFGLHLLLNPSCGQEMLEASAAGGYKAPELIKMREASKESDIYSLGVILLELVTRKDPGSSELLPVCDLRLPNTVRNPLFDRKTPEKLSPELLRQSGKQNGVTEEGLLAFYQLAVSCCSPSPLLRPDIKHVVRKLEALGRQFRPPPATKC